MHRKEFIRMIIRAGLFVLLAFILLALGKKITRGTNCSSCAGNGLCRGEIDCSMYLSKK